MARDFPGTAGNILSVGDVAALDITGTLLTISAWIQLDTNNAFHGIVAKADGAAVSSFQYSLYTDSGGKLNAAVGDASNGDFLAGATTVTTGVWHHAAMVKNGTGANALLCYLDGAQDGAFTSNRVIQNTAFSFIVGNRGDTAIPMDGRVAEVAVWDLALTAAEILALRRGTCPLAFRRDHLKGYFPLFGAAVPEADLSGNGNNLALTGTVPAANHAPVQPLSSVAA